MKKIFAIPVLNKKLSAHFGHSEEFAVITTDGEKVLGTEFFNPPVHQPGTYPRFLAEKGVNVIIAGGLGVKAQEIFKANNIEVHLGVNSIDPVEIVEQYLRDNLESGNNLCDH